MNTDSVISIVVIAVGIAVVLSSVVLWRAARRLDAAARSVLAALAALPPPPPRADGPGTHTAFGSSLAVVSRSGRIGTGGPGRPLRFAHFVFGAPLIKVMAVHTGATRTFEVIKLRLRRRSVP